MFDGWSMDWRKPLLLPRRRSSRLQGTSARRTTVTEGCSPTNTVRVTAMAARGGYAGVGKGGNLRRLDVVRFATTAGGRRSTYSAKCLIPCGSSQDVNVMGEWVHQSPGETLRARDCGPLVAEQIGDHRDWTPFPALVEFRERQKWAGA